MKPNFMKKPRIRLLLVFAILLGIGTFLASQKPLWTDEIFTQENIDQFSYSQLLTGKMKEGNLCPLFYVVQKLFLSAFNYHLPIKWQGEYSMYEPLGQVLIRIPAVLYMTFGLTLIFWIFAKNYSTRLGLWALVITLSSPAVWMYWAESRPYSLWFLLTTVQACLLHDYFLRPKSYLGWRLAITHVLLALTIIFSLPQILLVSILLLARKKISWKLFMALGIIPCIIIYAYYLVSKGVYTWLPSNALANVGAVSQTSSISLHYVQGWFSSLVTLNIPWAWMVLLVFGLFLGKKINKAQLVFSALSGILLGAALSILVLFSSWKASGIESYSVSERYFIYVIPFAVFAMALCGRQLMHSTKDITWKAMIAIVYGGTILVTLLQTFGHVLSLGIF
jgi:hypothetical protein